MNLELSYIVFLNKIFFFQFNLINLLLLFFLFN